MVARESTFYPQTKQNSTPRVQIIYIAILQEPGLGLGLGHTYLDLVKVHFSN